MAIKIDQIHQFIHLRAEGFSFDEIKRRTKISKPKLIQMNKELQEEISEVVAINEEHFITELRSRNLAKMKQLIDIREKIYKDLEVMKVEDLKPRDKILVLQFIEGMFSRSTNIDQYNKDLYNLRQEYDSKLDELGKQLKLIQENPLNKEKDKLGHITYNQEELKMIDEFNKRKGITIREKTENKNNEEKL